MAGWVRVAVFARSLWRSWRVNFHWNGDAICSYRRPAGRCPSSDGLRLPMRGKSLTARALSRYFVDEGVTSNTHVSDQ